MFENLIESHGVINILLLVEETEDQLLNPMDLHLFAHEWKIVMEVVKVATIGNINLQGVSLTPLLLSQLTDVKLFWVLWPSCAKSSQEEEGMYCL